MDTNRHSKVLLIQALTVGIILLVASVPAPASSAPLVGPNQPNDIGDCKRGGWQAYPHAGFRNQGDCIRFVITGVFECRDALGCVRYEDGTSLRIATALWLDEGEVLGLDSQRGAQLALNEQSDLFGHALELVPHNDGCSAEGGESAANAIAADPTVAAVVGTSCSAAARVAAPILSDSGHSMVSPSNTGPDLTAPGTHEAGYLRVSWNDYDMALAMAEFLEGQGVATSVVIVDGSTYSTGAADAFIDTFDGDNLTYLTANPDGSDAAVVIDQVIAQAPDVLFMPVFEPPGSALVNEARAAPELARTVLAGTDSLADQTFLTAAGVNAEGMFLTGPDTSFTETSEYQEFAQNYFDEFTEEPLTWFAPFGFDAANVILNAIEAVGTVDGDNTLHIGRQALRTRLFATSGLEGLTGTITCSALGECNASGLAILTVEGGQLVPVP